MPHFPPVVLLSAPRCLLPVHRGDREQLPGPCAPDHGRASGISPGIRDTQLQTGRTGASAGVAPSA